MGATETLETIREELLGLVERRSIGRWTRSDRARYECLGRQEAELLRGDGPARRVLSLRRQSGCRMPSYAATTTASSLEWA